MVTPEVASPLMIADWTGVGPRYLGRREGWMLRMPLGNMFRMLAGNIIPKEASMANCAFVFFMSCKMGGVNFEMEMQGRLLERQYDGTGSEVFCSVV